ncbi:taste receptor type 2 member 40-like [Phyllobates terribilis]|uniref:taste receptor type 2 member 40-like n=1 Tax=Phyllobates terribilis TaxID=111132 RepID=UPI003CCA8F03
MFIFVSNVLCWAKDNNAPQGDQLITIISVCNLVEEMMKSIRLFNIFYKSLFVAKIYIALCFMVTSCNVWFSTLLCVYFCLKIVKVKHTLYFQLQNNFHEALPWLYFSNILGSILVSIPLVLKTSSENSSRFNVSAISLQESPVLISFKVKDTIAFTILSLTAMLIFSISASAIIISLFKHINQVQQNFGGFRSPNMKAHVQASRTVMSFLFAYIITFLFMATVSLLPSDNVWIYVIYLLFNISKAVSCWNLIKGNRNLNKAFNKLLGELHCTNKSNDTEQRM